jgi:hypothetical protein
MKLTTSHLAALPPHTLRALREAGCISGLDVAKANAVRTDFLKSVDPLEEAPMTPREEYISKRESVAAWRAKVDRWADELVAKEGITKSLAVDRVCSGLHRAERDHKAMTLAKLGGGNLPQVPQGQSLRTFNDGKEWPVPPTAAEFAEHLAGKYMALDPNLKKSAALDKAWQDPDFKKMYARERDAQQLAATKLYG